MSQENPQVKSGQLWRDLFGNYVLIVQVAPEKKFAIQDENSSRWDRQSKIPSFVAVYSNGFDRDKKCRYEYCEYIIRMWNLVTSPT